MKYPSSNLFIRGSLAFKKRLHHLFEGQPDQHSPEQVQQVLPVQLIDQRRLFIRIAIQKHRNIFMQLNPLTTAGQIINCRGFIRKLPNGRFMLTNHKISYIFSFNQIRYIAG